MPEFTQFESGKSIILYFPPKGIAGFATSFVNAPSLEPCPPASSIATHSVLRFIILPPYVLMIENHFDFVVDFADDLDFAVEVLVVFFFFDFAGICSRYSVVKPGN